MKEVALLFLRLGVTAFGGPAAHIAMMREEVVKKRGWMTDQQLLDLMSAANLIPGPSSTEVAIQAGKLRAGWPGFFAAGIGFIVPASIIVTALTWFYMGWGRLEAAEAVLYGIRPAIVAIVLHSIWQLGHALL